MSDEFNWNDEAITLIPEQRETAVYLNPNGALVIRQRKERGEHDDPFIVIHPHHVPKLVERLQELAREAEDR